MLTPSNVAPKNKGQKMDLGTFLTDSCMRSALPSARADINYGYADLECSPRILGRRDGRYANAW